jgi:hypothetical protein
MFLIASHVKNNIECVLTALDNTEEDLSMGTEAFICTETFQKDRSLQRCMAQSCSGYFVVVVGFEETQGSCGHLMKVNKEALGQN